MKRFKKNLGIKVVTVFAILVILVTGGIWLVRNWHFVRNSGVSEDVPIRVEISVNKETAYIGDRIEYKIRVFADSDVEVKLPLPGEKLGDMLIDFYGEISTRTIWGITGYEQVYVLTTYETGEYVLPSPDIGYIVPGSAEGFIRGNDLSVAVKSLLAEVEGQPDIKDIKPLAIPPRDYKLFVFVGLGLILLAVIATVIHRARMFRRTLDLSEIWIARPPHECAYEELEKARDLLNTGLISRFYVRVSECIRKYLANRFNINAMEMATEEFLAVSKGMEELGGYEGLLQTFLISCDLVKFAKYKATEEDAWKMYYLAKKLIDETRETEDTTENSMEQADDESDTEKDNG